MNTRKTSVSPIQIHIIGAIASVVVLMASGYTVLSSWRSRELGIKAYQRELALVSDELSTAQRVRGRLLNQVADLESDAKSYDTVQSPQSINQLAVKIVALAEKYGLQLDQFEPSGPIANGTNLVQPIAMQAAAPYESVISWLDELHRSLPDIHVVALSIRSQGAGTASVNTNIQLNWYIPTENSSTQ